MDWEAPVDAWSVWLAVALVSIAVAGVVLSFPTGPPPDANQAANAIERTTGSVHDASASYDHDADEVKLERTTISLRNEHGTTHSSLAYGTFVPVLGDDRLETSPRHRATRSVTGRTNGSKPSVRSAYCSISGVFGTEIYVIQYYSSGRRADVIYKIPRRK